MPAAPPGMEAIVLAGGLGTRLRGVVDDVPKPLAPVGGRPFLAWLLDRLADAGIGRVVLSIGHLGHLVRAAVGTDHAGMTVAYAEENAPLGTGGATYAALGHCRTDRVLVLNGDTWLDADLRTMAARPGADVILAVREIEDRARYGSVVVRGDRITGLSEKGGTGPGLINGGLYLLRRDLPSRHPRAAPFSLETALLAEPDDLDVRAFVTAGHFLDIGTPADYAAAQTLIPAWAAAARRPA